MTLAKFANNHRSASKDRRYKHQVGQLRALPGIKRIGLGYVHQASHHKPAGSVGIVEVQNGAVLVHAYSSEGFCEIRCYTDEIDAVVARIASLPNALPQAPLEDETAPPPRREPERRAPAPVEDEVPEAPPGFGPDLAAAVADAVAAVLERALEPVRRQIAGLEKEIATLHGEYRSAIDLAAALESRLDEAMMWPGTPSGAPGPAVEGLPRGERMSVAAYIALRGWPEPPRPMISAIGGRIGRAAEAAGFPVKRRSGQAHQFPTAILRRFDAEIHAVCEDAAGEGRTTLVRWLSENGRPTADNLATRFLGAAVKRMLRDTGMRFGAWSSSGRGTRYPRTFLDENRDEIVARHEALLRRKPDAAAPGAPAAAPAAPDPEPGPPPDASAAARPARKGERRPLKDFLADSGVPTPETRVLRMLGIRIRNAAEEAGYDYAGEVAGQPRQHPVAVMRRMLPEIRALCEQPPAKAAPKAGKTKASGGDEDWPWRRADFATGRR